MSTELTVERTVQKSAFGKYGRIIVSSEELLPFIKKKVNLHIFVEEVTEKTEKPEEKSNDKNIIGLDLLQDGTIVPIKSGGV